MDINELKKLIKSSTSVLVLDNGDPSFVIVDYKVYKELVNERGAEKEIKINSVKDPAVSEIPNPEVSVDQLPSVRVSPVRNGSANGHDFHEKEAEILERLNKEILALKSQIEMEEKELAQ